MLSSCMCKILKSSYKYELVRMRALNLTHHMHEGVLLAIYLGVHPDAATGTADKTSHFRGSGHATVQASLAMPAKDTTSMP